MVLSMLSTVKTQISHSPPPSSLASSSAYVSTSSTSTPRDPVRRNEDGRREEATTCNNASRVANVKCDSEVSGGGDLEVGEDSIDGVEQQDGGKTMYMTSTTPVDILSRRKQRNPKPLFNSPEETDPKNTKMKPTNREPNENLTASTARSSVSDQEDRECFSPCDLSSMVKVEVHEGSLHHDATGEKETCPDPDSPPVADVVDAGFPPTPLPIPLMQAAFGKMMDSTAMPAGPHPPLFRFDKSNDRLSMSKDQLNLAARQNGLFPLGDLIVPNHSDALSVPMLIPMAYLYPLHPVPCEQQGGTGSSMKYRMFIPQGPGGDLSTSCGPVNAPFFPPPQSISNFNMTNNSQSNETSSTKRSTSGEMDSFSAPQQQSTSSTCDSGNKRQRHPSNGVKRETTTPLDLTKSPDNEIPMSLQGLRENLSQEETILPDQMSPQSIPGELRSTLDPPCNRSELGGKTGAFTPLLPPSDQEPLLKLQQKEFEAQLTLLKAKQLEFLKSTQQKQQQPLQMSSRCEECNINFSKHQNYLAHKQFYCAANTTKSNATPAPVQIVNENEEDDSHQRSTSSSPQQPIGQSSIALKKNTQLNKSSVRTTPPMGSAVSPTVVSSVSPSSQHPAAAAAATVQALSSMLGLVNSKDLSSMDLMLLKQQQQELVNKELQQINKETLQSAMSTQQTADEQKQAQQMLLAAVTSGGMSRPGGLTHFVCEGCGIRFKSANNLHAHQARYCASRKAAVSDVEKNPFETMMKRAIASQQQPQKGGNMLSRGFHGAADMLAFLNAAKSSAEYALDTVNKPTTSSALSTATTSSAAAASDDYCCILCGYKESSVDRLKDHINMHFIGQIKRVNPPSMTTGDTSDRKSLRSPKTTSHSDRGSSNLRDAHHVNYPPENKRIKLENPAETEDDEDSGANRKDTNKNTINNNSNESEKMLTSPPITSHQSLHKLPPLIAMPTLATTEPPLMRCTCCDIGFSQLSNFLAHKKYYCRGLSSPSSNLPSPPNNLAAGNGGRKSP